MNKFLTYSLIFLLFLFCPNQVYAEEMKNYTISFEQAYELMLVNSNELKSAHLSKTAAKYERNSARGLFAPKVAVNTTVAMLDHDIAIKIPQMGKLPLQNKNLWLGSAGVVWNIFTGGKIIAANQIANAKYDISDHKYIQKKSELTADLIKKYYGVCLMQDVLKVRAEVLTLAELHLQDALKYEKEGFIAKSERLHAEVAKAKAERDYKAAKRDLQVANSALLRLINSDIDTSDIEINPQSRLFMSKTELPDIQDIQKVIIENNPIIKQAKAKSKITKAIYNSQKAEYMPTVTVGAYDIFGADSLSTLVPRMAFAATANMTVFDGFSRLNNLKSAKTSYLQTNTDILVLKNQLLTYSEKLYSDVQKAKEQYESTDISIESAKEALRITTLSFKEGYSSSLSVTDAQTALSGEKIARLNALYDYDTSLIKLIELCGDTDEIFDYINNSVTERL